MRLKCPCCESVIHSNDCILLDPVGKSTAWYIVCPNCDEISQCRDARAWMETVIADWKKVMDYRDYVDQMRAEHGVFG